MTLAVSFLSRLAGGDDGESYFAGGGAGNGVDAGQLLSGGKPSDAAGGPGPAGAGGDGQTVWCGCLSLVFYQQVRGCGAFCLFVFLSFCGVTLFPVAVLRLTSFVFRCTPPSPLLRLLLRCLSPPRTMREQFFRVDTKDVTERWLHSIVSWRVSAARSGIM